MNEETRDTGLITVLLQRFKSQNLPTLLDLKDKVGQGEPLDDLDIRFMKEVSSNFEQVKPLLNRHPELEKLVVQAIQLYTDITDSAIDNEPHS